MSTKVVLSIDGRDYFEDEFTCHTCPDKDKCRLAYDPYNTDGDCLMMK